MQSDENITQSALSPIPNIVIDPSTKPFAYPDIPAIKAVTKEALKMESNEILVTSLLMKEKPSDNFAAIHVQLQLIIDFMRTDSTHRKVTIYCPDEDSARMYKVVYNFYYPIVKSDRIKDSHWD